MANMDYCKFTNTLQDLRQCYEAIDDCDLSEEEEKARTKLIKLCMKIADDNAPDDGIDY